MKKFAMVFPGQGSQTVGMLADLATEYPIVTETFKQASDELGYDLWHLVQQGPAEELNKTWQTQPALLAASVAIYRAWQEKFPQLKNNRTKHNEKIRNGLPRSRFPNCRYAC